MIDNAAIEGVVQEYIVSNFLPGDPVESLHRDDLLIEGGIIDSGSIMMFILFLEEKYDIQVHDEELFADNFATVHHVVDFIDRKLKRKMNIQT
ncbi:acyl carrier protein [Gemmatimonadota bacterium]